MEGGLTYEGAFFAITIEGGLIYEHCWWHNLCHNSPMWRVVVVGEVSPSSLHQPQLATWASCGISCDTTLILNLLGLTSKLRTTQFRHPLAWELGFLVVISIGMAISARSMGTRPGLTLMDLVLPSPIKNRAGFGFGFFFFFLKKKTQSWFRSGLGFGPNPTRLQLK